MAKGKEVKNWITINGAHVPIYADGSMGGIGAKLQGKQGSSKNDISEKEDQKQLDDIEAKRNKMYSIIKKVQKEYGDDDDGFAEDILSDIVEDNGHDLSDDEIRELASQYYDEEDEDEDEDWYDDSEELPRSIPKDEAPKYKKDFSNASISDVVADEDARYLVDRVEEASRDGSSEGKTAKEWAEQLEEEYGYRYDSVLGKKEEEMPFQSKGLSKEEKAEDWANEAQKDIASKKANIKEMGYVEAGQFISDHKEEFGLSDDDDAYQIAAQIKNGDIKLDKDGKVSKADRDKVQAINESMDRAAKERGDYIEDEPANDGKIKANMPISKDKGNSTSQEVLRLRDELNAGKSATTTNKEVADMYAANKNPNFKFTVEKQDDGSYKITAEKAGKKKPASLKEKKEIQDIADAHVKKIWNGGAANRELYEAADEYAKKSGYNPEKVREAAFAAMNEKQMAEIAKREKAKAAAPEKLIKIGDKKVAVSKEKPATKSVRSMIGDDGDWKISKAYDKRSLKELALDAGLSSKKVNAMSVSELRETLLALWRKG